MSFAARPRGYTLRRIQALGIAPPEERIPTSDHPIAMRCKDCGQLGYGRRDQLREALEEHRKTCPARRSAGEVHETTIWYPGVL